MRISVGPRGGWISLCPLGPFSLLRAPPDSASLLALVSWRNRLAPALAWQPQMRHLNCPLFLFQRCLSSRPGTVHWDSFPSLVLYCGPQLSWKMLMAQVPWGYHLTHCVVGAVRVVWARGCGVDSRLQPGLERKC